MPCLSCFILNFIEATHGGDETDIIWISRSVSSADESRVPPCLSRVSCFRDLSDLSVPRINLECLSAELTDLNLECRVYLECHVLYSIGKHILKSLYVRAREGG